MLDEAVLISQLKDPSTRDASYRTLVSTHKERLYWHIRKMVLNHEDTDDILQNTFLKVFLLVHRLHSKSPGPEEVLSTIMGADSPAEEVRAPNASWSGQKAISDRWSI